MILSHQTVHCHIWTSIQKIGLGRKGTQHRWRTPESSDIFWWHCMTYNTKGSTTWHHPTIPSTEQKFSRLPPIMKHQDIIQSMHQGWFPGCPPAGGNGLNFLLPELQKDPPLLLLMIQLILQLQHLHQVFCRAVLDHNTIQVVHPIVEVSNPKDYLMILDHGGGGG